MEGELKSRVLAEVDPMYQLVIDMVEAMRAATAPLTAQAEDPRDAMSAIMTAASMFAGAQFGTLLLLGEVRQQDIRRAAEAAARNFREGVKVGTNRAARVAAQEVGGHA